MSAPPPPPSALPPPPKKATFVPVKGGDIRSQIESNVELKAEEEELSADKLVSTDVLPKIVCPRCEQKLLETEYQSHRDAHSSEIIDGFLFLGSMQNAHNKKELTVRTGITDIVNVAEEVENVFVECRTGCECIGGGIDCNGREEEGSGKVVQGDRLFTYHSLKIKDMAGEDIIPVFDALLPMLQELERQKKRVLVHCVQGISRSSSLVIAYLMYSRGWCLKKACDHVRSRRGVARPIPYFVEMLQIYEKHLGQKMQLEGYDGEHPSLVMADLFDPDERLIQTSLIPVTIG